MIDVPVREIELVLAPLVAAAVFAAAIRRYPQELDVAAFAQRDHAAVEETGRRIGVLRSWSLAQAIVRWVSMKV